MRFPEWLTQYKQADLSGDIVAGVVTAVVLVPQAMAYGLLAGLPPAVALYSSVLPLIFYAFLGSSRTLAIGPVGLMSLMTGATLLELGLTDPQSIISAAHTLALMVGFILLIMRLTKLSLIINFLSHPVISGFVSASAIIIALSQMKHLLGIDIDNGLAAYETLWATVMKMGDIKLTTATLGILSLILLWLFKTSLSKTIEETTLPSSLKQFATKSGPLIAVGITTCAVYWGQLDKTHEVDTIGAIPAGLPSLLLPNLNLELLTALLPSAVLIALVGYLESFSIAKSMASQKRQHVDAEQELVGLGSANIASAISGGYPVAGGFGRSMVNFTAGANTPLASIITALIVAITLFSLTSLFFYLPKATLSAVIILAVIPLIDTTTLKHAWNYDRSDAFALLSTFFTVLATDVETGLVVGTIISIALYLFKSSKPHIAIVGRVEGTEHYRNVDRHNVSTHKNIVAIRVDENLYFANTNYLESTLMKLIADDHKIEHIVLICSSISMIDTSALESLDNLLYRLKKVNVQLHLAEVKGPVMDKLKHTHFYEKLGEDNVFLSTHLAMEALK